MHEYMLDAWLQKLDNPIFRAIGEFLGVIGDNGILYFIIALILMLIIKYRKAGIFLFINLFFCAGIGVVLKKIIGRERPCFAHSQDVVCYVDENQFASCPSGHMIMATAFCLVMCKYFPKYKWFWIGFTVLMGISRMYMGAHYLSDLLVSVMIAIVVFVVISIVWKQYFRKHCNQK